MSKPRKLRHHRLATTQDRYEVEVWADATDGQLTLYIDCPEHTTWVALTPAEGRALAALLVVGADQKEKDLTP